MLLTYTEYPEIIPLDIASGSQVKVAETFVTFDILTSLTGPAKPSSRVIDFIEEFKEEILFCNSTLYGKKRGKK